MNKKGRPKLPDTVKRTVIFSLRLTTAEADLVYRHAHHADLSAAELVRKMLKTLEA